MVNERRPVAKEVAKLIQTVNKSLNMKVKMKMKMQLFSTVFPLGFHRVMGVLCTPSGRAIIGRTAGNPSAIGEQQFGLGKRRVICPANE